MKLFSKSILAALLFAGVVSLQTGCSMLNGDIKSKIISNENGKVLDFYNDNKENEPSSDKIDHASSTIQEKNSEDPSSSNSENKSNESKTAEKKSERKQWATNADAVKVIGQPEAIAVLVNKQNKLPDNYSPKDLVYPDVPFTFNEKADKRKMRANAAKALEKLFAGAKDDGILLAGVSGYRSFATQQVLFNNYVNRDGQKAAELFSARPGHSEHQTGLAMDVSGHTGICAAQDCFDGTPEADWLAKHAHEYGFIIRYPKGKEQITGYQYEPWHLRYVGTDISKEIHKKGITLEEYYNVAVPVSEQK
ncbi:M15 family metallopeptidase [Lederbergia citrea]